MRKHAFAVGLVLCLGIGISCSSGTKPGQPEAKSASSKTAAGTVNACDLVTLEDVREFYGPQMAVSSFGTETDRGPAADLSKCLYRTSGPLPHRSLNIVARVSHLGEDTWGNHDLFIKQSKEQLSDFRYEEVEGLGAPAIWQTEGPSSGRLTVFLGTAFLGMAADNAPGKDRKEIATALMKKALARFRASQ
jgi:hypothetical protein